jgi:hypothetical protein
MEQIHRLEHAGYCIQTIRKVIGQHSPKWTSQLIFDRYFDLMEKFKIYKYKWLKDLPQKLTKKYQEDPSEINFFAMMGAIHSTRKSDVRCREKDYRIKDDAFIATEAEYKILKSLPRSHTSTI